MYQASLGFFSAAPVWYKNNIFRQLRNLLYFCPFLWFTYLMTTKQMQQYTQNFVLQKYGKYWFLLFFSILFEKIMFYAQKKVKLWIFSLISIIEKNATNNFFSSKYHRRKIIISTFLKCFTLHWLEYLVHFFTLSTNDDIKTPIFIARIYCIGSFFKPKKILFYIP